MDFARPFSTDVCVALAFCHLPGTDLTTPGCTSLRMRGTASGGGLPEEELLGHSGEACVISRPGQPHAPCHVEVAQTHSHLRRCGSLLPPAHTHPGYRLDSALTAAGPMGQAWCEAVSKTVVEWGDELVQRVCFWTPAGALRVSAPQPGARRGVG